MSIKQDISDRLAARKPETALARARQYYAAGKYERALKLFGVAAEAGIAESEREVGRHYLTGEGVRRNAMEAARWFLRAAEKGDIIASRNLAGLYMFGLREDALSRTGASLFSQVDDQQDENAKPDYEAALRWALPAAEAGDTDAQLMAGFIYANAPAPVRDDAKALPWFEKAAAAGAPQGHLGIGVTLMRTAAGDAPAEAVEHLRLAADADLPTAHYYLALIYEMGVNVPADPALAAELTIELPVQVNGKVRFTIEVPAGAGEDEIRRALTAHGDFGRHTGGAEVQRIVVVPGRIANVVTRPG